MRAAEFLERVSRLKVLIVGDVCLDHWCYYDPALAVPSAETGIPRLAVTWSEKTPGAAGTVANNLKSLGVAEVAVLGVVGEDGHAFELTRALEQRSISSGLLIRDASLPTFTYTKLINSQTGVEDQPRVDFIFTRDMPRSVDGAVSSRLHEVAARFDLICVSDQAETERGGIVTEQVRQELNGFARGGKLVWVDSRRRIEHFRHAYLKVNEEEAQGALGRLSFADPSRLGREASARALFVTRGGEGIDIFRNDEHVFLPTHRVPNPVDICGAGDSFTAGAATAIAAGATLEAAARLGHLVASVTIMKKGTGSASPQELAAAETSVAEPVRKS
jgi:rfaE bifunctional protein kinase chain/domain